MQDRSQVPDQTRSKHHYVTRAYLKGMFADGESRLWVYERNSDHVFQDVPKNLASTRAYYTIVDKDGSETDKYEKLLGEEVERLGIPVLRRLSHDMKQLTWQEREQGAILIAMQELRVPYMRDQLSHMMKELYKSLFQTRIFTPGLLERHLERRHVKGKIVNDVSADELRRAVMNGDIALEMLPEASLRALGYSLPALINAYVKMKWTVLISNGICFVTSDCPVCRDYPQTHNFPAGIVNPDLTVYFPISQFRVLRICLKTRGGTKSGICAV